MSEITKRRLAKVLWAFIVLAWVGDSVLLFLTADLAPSRQLGAAMLSLEDFAFVLVGALGLVILLRQPGNAVGWWIMVAGLSFPLDGFTAELAEWGYAVSGPAPWVLAVGWFPRWVWLLSSINLPFTLLVFPDGKLPSPRWRPAVWLAVAVLAVVWVFAAFDPRPLAGLNGLPNPLGIPALAAFGDQVMDVMAPLLQAVLPMLAAASLIPRYRRGTLIERQQVKV
ncbi:MAG: hypothetical protein ACRDVD_05335, partial [Acidimicrobiia bacterium]